MKKVILVLSVITMFFLVTGIALAASYPWRAHASPYDFLFGNHIDTHQQSMVIGGGKLVGFFYIRFTGGQSVEGSPIAMHADCTQVPDECTVGWKLHGVPIRATLVEHQPHQHPTWCVDPADLPPQPGFSHFHWLGPPDRAKGLTIGQTYDGLLLKLTAVQRFFFEHHGGFEVTPGIDTVTHANVITECP